MPPGMRVADWQNHPWDYAWWFTKTEVVGTQISKPGLIIVSDAPSGGQQSWPILVKAFDPVAQKHLNEIGVKQGPAIQMPDGRVLYLAYKAVDDEADALLGRGGQPYPDRSPIDILLWDGGKWIKCEKWPRDWFEARARDHAQWRTQQPDIVLNLGNAQLSVPFAFFDGMCKDFMRRRGDFVAAGWWPELLMQDYGQIRTPDGKSVAPPVQGRADALGHGVNVMNGQQPGAPQQAVHPMSEHEGIL